MPDDKKLLKGIASGLLNAAPAKQVGLQQGSKEFDTVPSYLYFVKAVQDGNIEGANLALSHVRDMQGEKAMTDLMFLGKRLQQTNINDLAKRGVSREPNPELKKLFRVVNENPEVMNRFEFVLPPAPMANMLAGGR